MDWLSPRQRTVKALLDRGLTVREVAQQLGISPSTVRQHRADAREREEAVRDEWVPEVPLWQQSPWLHAYLHEFENFLADPTPETRYRMTVALAMARSKP